jgi:UPF0716 protein FxsA
MTSTHAMRAFLERGYLFKLLLALLAYSLVPLGEIFFFLFLGSLIGNYLVLVLAAVAGVAGAFAGIVQGRRLLSAPREAPVSELAGLAVAALLLITPGFITDVLGFLLLVPPVRAWAGRHAAAFLKSRAPAVYRALSLTV